MMFIPATILAIDPGAVAGWAIFRSGNLLSSGSADTPQERERAVSEAIELSEGSALVVAAETWRPMKSHRTMMGMGAAWGLWLAELQRAEVKQRRIIRVEPETWRRACYGQARVPREEAKPRAIQFVKRCYGVAAGEDEAEAICIGAWASEAQDELKKALGARELARLEGAS